jgi:3-oxoacyl-[acyl-carrier protein] reductase
MQLTFPGKYFLISGGSSDMGLAIAQALIRENIHPFLGFRSEEGARKIENSLGKDSSYSTVFLEYGDYHSLDALFDLLPDEIGCFIDCAHGNFESYIGSFEINHVRDYYERNLIFRAEFLRRLTRKMMGCHKGRLIFISSTSAQRINPGQGFYSSAKLACEALYRTIGIECGSRGITSVSLRLGYVDAGRGAEYLDKDRNRETTTGSKIPVKRALSLEEISHAVVHYSSCESSILNATEVTIDGGMCSAK